MAHIPSIFSLSEMEEDLEESQSPTARSNGDPDQLVEQEEEKKKKTCLRKKNAIVAFVVSLLFLALAQMFFYCGETHGSFSSLLLTTGRRRRLKSSENSAVIASTLRIETNNDSCHDNWQMLLHCSSRSKEDISCNECTQKLDETTPTTDVCAILATDCSACSSTLCRNELISYLSCRTAESSSVHCL